MTGKAEVRHGGQIVVECLRANGVDQVFGVPGESYLPVLDALFDAPDIRLTIACHEGAASMMADADGKMTGRPGICLVTRGPGAANAYAGIHVAAQDSTPMIVLVGQIGRDVVDREAFQEIDIKAMFSDQVKWACEVRDTERLAEYMARAFSVAMSGRPGPVVLGLPEDVLRGTLASPPARASVVSQPAPPPAAMATLNARLAGARRPLLIVGGESWTSEDCARLEALSERLDVPVATAFRCQDRFSNDHPNYAGDSGLGINPALAERIRSADLVVALGARLGDCTTSSYTLFDSPWPHEDGGGRALVHVHADAEEPGRVFQPDLAINAGVSAFLAACGQLDAPADGLRADWTRSANADYRAWSDAATPVAGDFNLGEAVIWLRENLPADTLIANGAGNYAIWFHRFYRHTRHRTQLAPTSGTMGYGLPGAIAAKLRHRDRVVLAVAGDGCFQMTCQELATAAAHGLAIVVIVVNNGMYGTIRMHQEAHYPDRTIGTDIVNPDFAALAKAYGFNAERVTRTDAFSGAMERALSAGTGTLIEIVTDTRILTPEKMIGGQTRG